MRLLYRPLRAGQQVAARGAVFHNRQPATRIRPIHRNGEKAPLWI